MPFPNITGYRSPNILGSEALKGAQVLTGPEQRSGGSCKAKKSRMQTRVDMGVDQYSWPPNDHGEVFPFGGELLSFWVVFLLVTPSKGPFDLSAYAF